LTRIKNAPALLDAQESGKSLLHVVAKQGSISDRSTVSNSYVRYPNIPCTNKHLFGCNPELLTRPFLIGEPVQSALWEMQDPLICASCYVPDQLTNFIMGFDHRFPWAPNAIHNSIAHRHYIELLGATLLSPDPHYGMQFASWLSSALISRRQGHEKQDLH
jgi:hypothetical protein